MTISEERKYGNVQKTSCRVNCPSRSASVPVQPCSCLVVQSHWSESDGRRRARSSRTEASQAAGKSRKSTRDEVSTLGQKSSASASPKSPKRPADIRPRVQSHEIAPTHGQKGPTEIGPGRHKPTKTSELRTQWMRGGYSLSQEDKKHLKAFNRLPFVSSGKESTCIELVSDRVQRLNHERKEKMVEIHHKEVIAAMDPVSQTQQSPPKTEKTPKPTEEKATTDASMADSTPVATAETTPNAAETVTPAAMMPETPASAPAPVAETPASTPVAETATAIVQSADRSEDITSMPATGRVSPPSANFSTGILAAAFSFARTPASSAGSTARRSTSAAKNSRT